MRRIIAVLSIIALLLASPLPAGQSATGLSASDYAGLWRNKDPSLMFIQFIRIEAVDSNTVQISAWLRCIPPTAEGGRVKDCQYWGTDEVYSSNFEEVIWKHTEHQKDGRRQRTASFKNVLTLHDRTLKVFTEGPGWENYFVRIKRLPR